MTTRERNRTQVEEKKEKNVKTKRIQILLRGENLIKEPLFERKRGEESGRKVKHVRGCPDRPARQGRNWKGKGGGERGRKLPAPKASWRRKRKGFEQEQGGKSDVKRGKSPQAIREPVSEPRDLGGRKS